VEGILLHFRWIQQHSVGLVCDRHRVHGPALGVRAERLLKCSSAPARSGAAPTPVRAGRVLELGLLRRQRLRRQASVELVHDSVLEQEVLVPVLQRDHRRLEEQNRQLDTGTGRLQLYDHVQDESYVIGYVQNTTATLRKGTPFLMLLQPGKGRLFLLFSGCSTSPRAERLRFGNYLGCAYFSDNAIKGLLSQFLHFQIL
jgi:hypothetical protein